MFFGDEERGAGMVDKLAFVFQRGCDFLGRHRSLQRLPIIEPQFRDAVERRLARPERAMNRVALNVLAAAWNPARDRTVDVAPVAMKFLIAEMRQLADAINVLDDWQWMLPVNREKENAGLAQF